MESDPQSKLLLQRQKLLLLKQQQSFLSLQQQKLIKLELSRIQNELGKRQKNLKSTFVTNPSPASINLSELVLEADSTFVLEADSTFVPEAETFQCMVAKSTGKALAKKLFNEYFSESIVGVDKSYSSSAKKVESSDRRTVSQSYRQSVVLVVPGHGTANSMLYHVLEHGTANSMLNDKNVFL